MNDGRLNVAYQKTIADSPHLAKIAVPWPHKVQGRERLFDVLDRNREQRIVWVQGPPGAGKTVLASTYIAERKLRVLWDQLDERDNDIASFFHYLALAFKAVFPRSQKPLPRLTPEYLPGLLTFTQRFFEMLAQRIKAPAVIVLDNYHEVARTALLHEVLREAAESLPHGVSFLILSRSDPPSSLARLRLHGHLALIGGEDLKFTREEVERIVPPFLSKKSQSRIAELHEQTQGWAAGLRLLLDYSENIDSHAHHLISGKAQQVLFDYFATEVFERWPVSIQTAVLRSALLPTMTVLQTEKLTDEVTIGSVLADLYQRNYFTVLRADNIPRYEYHPLFREFLLNRARTVFDQAEWRVMQRRAAGLLTETGQSEAAAPLYHAACDWEGLQDLVLREAPALIIAGRHQTLIQWLNFLPPAAFEKVPWLSYWHGLARLPFSPVEARGIFEQAYLSFQAQEDAVGLYSSWSGVMDSFFFEWRDFTPVDRWIKEFEQLRTYYPEFPSRAVELRTYWSMGTLMHRQPHHPFLREWSERGLLLLDVADRDLSILLGGYLVVCFLWWGETVKARGVIDRLTPWTHSPDVSPIVYILWSCAVALYHSVRGETELCNQSVEGGLALAQRTGLHAFDFLLFAQGARCCLVAGELSQAEAWIASMSKTMRSHSHIDGLFFHHLKSNAAAQRGDWLQSVEHARIGIAMSIQAGTPFPEAHCRIDLARGLIGLGNDKEWPEQLCSARAIGQAMGSQVLEYLCFETEAMAAFRQSQEDKGLKKLAQALAVSRTMGGATWLLEGPKVSAALYNHALTAGIEVSHVQQMILQRRLSPLDPSTAAESWPRPIKIYTLGRFDIVCDDIPLRSPGKPQHKPLELLKCLCAFGGNAINQDLITDALWPDTEGDMAEQVLRTTLHRLRKLLKYDQAIRLEDRHLSLDRCYIWVDCLAFDRAAHCMHMLSRAFLKQTLNCYRGPFLAGESAPWALAFRERLRAHYLGMAERLGTILEQDEDWRGAVECYLHVVEVEPVAEIFYRRLMHSYAQLGRHTEALAVYQRCRHSLLTRLGVSPAEETQNLYHALQ